MINLISIGSNCKPRYQIDHFLRRINPRHLPSSYFFDSLMGGNIEGAISIIESNFVLRSEDIFVVERDGRFIPGHRPSGFVFLHDFGTKDVYWSSHADCESALATAFDNSMAKYDYLGQKTVKLLASEKDISLVYYGQASEHAFAKLQHVLRSKYGRNFTIVNVLNGRQRAAIRNGLITTVFVDDNNSPKLGTSCEWEGWNESWAAALAAIWPSI